MLHLDLQLAVAEHARLLDQGRGLGLSRHRRKHRIRQPIPGLGAATGVDRRHQRLLLWRHLATGRPGPGLGLVGQSNQQLIIGLHHVFHQAVREQPGRGVPIDEQAPRFVFIHFIVQPGLRGLGDPIHPAQTILTGAKARFSQQAGEHHRQQAGFGVAGPPGQRPLHVHTTERPLIQVARQLVLLRPRPRHERTAPRTRYRQRDQAGEHTQHTHHLGMQDLTIPHGQVEGEPVLPGPVAQGFAVRAQQHR